MSLFHKDKKVDKSIKKIDAIVTGLVLGGIVASVYGIKKHEDEKKKLEVSPSLPGKMTYKQMLKGLIFGFKEEKTIEKKKGLIKILLSKFFGIIFGSGKK